MSKDVCTPGVETRTTPILLRETSQGKCLSNRLFCLLLALAHPAEQAASLSYVAHELSPTRARRRRALRRPRATDGDV